MDEMLGKTVRVLVTMKAEWLRVLADLIEKLTSSHGESWFKNLKLFLRKEPCEWESEKPVIQTDPTPTVWTVDEGGDIRFSLTSNGFTREQWEWYLKRRGWRISNYAYQVLHRAREVPTNAKTYHIVVQLGKNISDSDRVTKKIREAADKKGWVKPHWEVACLIRDTFTDEQLEQMGIWYIVTMHEPIKDADNYLDLIRSCRGDAGRWLLADCDGPEDYWNIHGGFAFEIPQPVHQN